MKCLKSIFLMLLVGVSLSVNAQAISLPDDSIHTGKYRRMKSVVFVPAILLTAGAIAATDNELIDKFEIHEERQEHIPKFRTHVDDYLQYAPIAAVYGLNLAGFKGKHDVANRTALLVKSELLMMAMVIPLKKITAVPRPDTGVPNSFPSGHTAQAFAAATFLHKEYGKKYPAISVLGYATATSVGILRVLNNRHWVSDVLVGAGIGILATNIAYATHRNKWGKRHPHLSGITLTPSCNRKSLGIYMALPVH